MKKKISKSKKDVIEIQSDELSLILEALKKQERSVIEDRFYRADHPQAFYEIYLERYWRLIDKLDRRIPNDVFLKMPKL